MATDVEVVWQTLGVLLAVLLGGLGMSLAATVAFALLADPLPHDVEGRLAMKRLRFYGQGDDLVEFDTDGRWPFDEVGAYARGGAFRIEHNGRTAMYVHAIYSPEPLETACWVVGVTLAEEGVPLPDWPMRFETRAGRDPYSPVLIIEAPDDVMVEAVTHEKDGL